MAAHQNGGGQAVEVLRDGGQQRPPQGHARPSQVGVARRVDAGQGAQGRHRARCGARVRDPAGRDAPQGVLARVGGRIHRPVGDHGRVRLQQRHHQGVDARGGLAARLQDDDVGQARGVAHADLRVEQRFGSGRGRVDHDDHPARVLPGDRVGYLDGVVDIDEVGHADQQREDAAQRGRSALLAQLHDPRGDLRRRRVLQSDDHGSLHMRPSSASIRCALGGPHAPGAYCSGWPWPAQ